MINYLYSTNIETLVDVPGKMCTQNSSEVLEGKKCSEAQVYVHAVTDVTYECISKVCYQECSAEVPKPDSISK